MGPKKHGFWGRKSRKFDERRSLKINYFWTSFWDRFWQVWGRFLGGFGGPDGPKIGKIGLEKAFPIKLWFVIDLGRVLGGFWEALGRVLGGFWQGLGAFWAFLEALRAIFCFFCWCWLLFARSWCFWGFGRSLGRVCAGFCRAGHDNKRMGFAGSWPHRWGERSSLVLVAVFWLFSLGD